MGETELKSTEAVEKGTELTEETKEEKDVNVTVKDDSQEETVIFKKHTTPVRKLRYARAFVMELFCVVLIVYVFFNFIFGIFVAPNDDMYPVAASGDLMMYYRLDRDVLSKDIIVFNYDGVMRTARVVGRGGDTVDITDDGSVIVNGNTIIETNIHTATYRYEGYIDYPVKLGEDECFVLCEARNGTEDSRYFGPVHKSMIKGTTILILRRNSL